MLQRVEAPRPCAPQQGSVAGGGGEISMNLLNLQHSPSRTSKSLSLKLEISSVTGSSPTDEAPGLFQNSLAP